jgi:hypothetical protein
LDKWLDREADDGFNLGLKHRIYGTLPPRALYAIMAWFLDIGIVFIAFDDDCGLLGRDAVQFYRPIFQRNMLHLMVKGYE